jgi:hypothetical protein
VCVRARARIYVRICVLIAKVIKLPVVGGFVMLLPSGYLK